MFLGKPKYPKVNIGQDICHCWEKAVTMYGQDWQRMWPTSFPYFNILLVICVTASIQTKAVIKSSLGSCISTFRVATNTLAGRTNPLLCGQNLLGIPTPEKGKKVFWVSVVTVSLKFSLLKGCNKYSRVTPVVRNSYTLFHKLAVPVVLLNICCLAPGYRLRML